MTFPGWPKLEPDELERQLLEQWRAERLFHRTLAATRQGPPFVFYEGPPTANGRPGIHHVFARTIKDLVCRFHAMQGQSVTRIAGWDTHGLPVEIEVEKELGLSGKRAIEEYGVEKFNQLCRKSVFTYKADWEQLSDRIGYWLDYEHPYVTYTKEYIETVWWLLRQLHDRKLLDRGHRVLPYCPRCGTVLSSHELALGYEEIKDKSIYLTFPLNDGTGRELVVWTTTPWTLPSNVAVAVNPNLEYGEYQVDGRVLVLATARAGLPARPRSPVRPGAVGPAGVSPVGATPPGSATETFADLGARRTFRGRDLVGLKYHRPLDVVPLPPNAVHSIVIGGDFVTADEGSGIVHLAPAFGADDYAAGQEHGLALLRPVGPDGAFSGTTWPELEGRLVTADETNDLITRRLKTEGRWLRTEEYVHDYPHCWRCASKLIYYARDSWFVRTSVVKDRMLEVSSAVDWHPPEVGAGRFGEWLANNVDWALSRDRYWGTPLPVWVCDREASHVEVIGSYSQLAERWGKPLPPGFDPHKPHIDGYTWGCACGGTLHRVPEVIDAWFDSGAMPYAQWHYPFEHEAEFRAHFPADFICEGVDQTRGWFYSLLAIAVTAFDRPAYRHVIVNELVLDAEGQKMSKSRGNVVDPWAMIRQFGADAVRVYLLAASQVWLPKRFDPRTVPEVTGRFFDTLRNSYRFFASYAGGWTPEAPGSDLTHSDRWLLGRLDATIATVTRAWGDYDVTAGVRALMDFLVDDLSNWYVRLNRARFWAPDREADPGAVATLYEALLALSRLLAPAAPFASDWLHRALVGESVHLARFPTPGGRQDPGLELAMDAVRRLVSLGRAGREVVKLRVRQPLARMQVALPGGIDGPLFRDLLELLRLEMNVKRVELVASDAELVRLKPKPNFRSLGKRYGKETPAVAAAVQGLGPEQLRALEAGGTASLALNGRTITYLSEDVVVEREVTSDWVVQSNGPFVVALDPQLTPDLVREGLARELIHVVQRLRKDAGYTYSTRIELAVNGPAVVLEAAREHAAFIRSETLARRLEVGATLADFDREEAVDLDGHAVTLSVRQLEAAAAASQPTENGTG